MTALPHSSDHRVAATARWCGEVLAEVSEVPLWSMGADEAGETLVALTRARAQLDELLMRVLRHAETVETGQRTGAVSATMWWAHATRTDTCRGAPRGADCRGPRASRHRPRRTRVRHAPDRPGPRHRGRGGRAARRRRGLGATGCHGFLLEKAGEHDARALRVLGRRLLEVIDPEAADAEESRRLEAEEARARAVASLAMSDDGHGQCHGRFTLPSLHGQMLRKHLMALASPARPSSSEESAQPDPVEAPTRPGVHGVRRDPSRRLRALRGRRARHHRCHHGARDPDGRARRLPRSTPVAASVPARRDASPAGPASSRSSSVGRPWCSTWDASARFHTESQRIALAVPRPWLLSRGLRHATRHVPRPPRHPLVPRRRDRREGPERLLCSRHHRRIHDPAFHHSLDKHGQVLFSRRT